MLFPLPILLSVLVCLGTAPAGEENLLPNGSFEAGMDGWQFWDRPSKAAHADGRVTIVHDRVHHGQAALHLEKSANDTSFPQLSVRPVAIIPGEYYQVTAWVDSTQLLQAQCAFEQPNGRLTRTVVFPPAQGWKLMTLRWHAPPEAKRMGLTLQLRKKGQAWLDDVRLQRTAPFEDRGETLGLQSKQADPIHGLTELALRRRIKPFAMLKSPAGSYPSERVVFRDTVTGTVLWKMSHNPGYNRHTYSNIPVWNVDGSKLMLRSDHRPGRGRWWLVEPDGSRWSPFDQEFRYWSPVDPHTVYTDAEFLSKRGPIEIEILQADVATGQCRPLWRLPLERWHLPPAKREWKLLTPSHDGKKFLVRETDQLANGTSRSFGVLLNADGTGQPQRFDLGVVAGQTWFLKRDDYSFMFNDSFSIKGAYHDCQWICEPAKGGAIRAIDPFEHYSHAGVSPSGKYVAHLLFGLRIIDIDSGASQLRVPGGVPWRSGGEHLSWECDDRWLVASMGNTISEVWTNEDRTRLVCVPNTQHNKNAECEPESSPDGTKFGYASTMLGDLDFYVAVQRLPDPPRNVRREGRLLTWEPPQRCRELAGYCVYRGAQPLSRQPIRQCRCEVPAADGQYTVVAMERSGLQSSCPDREPPPVLVGLHADACSPYAVNLSWQASAAADVSYYNVYCSSKPKLAAVQENRIASPSQPQLLDWGLLAGTQYYYLVTAVDRAGNESSPCAPVAVRTPLIERVLERIPLGKALDQQPLTVSLSAPRDDRYLLWLQLKAGHVPSHQLLRLTLDGPRPIYWRPTWDFVCIGHDDPEAIPFSDLLKSDGHADPWFNLKAGTHRLSVSLPNGSAEILSVILTNDAGFAPEGVISFPTDGNEAPEPMEMVPRSAYTVFSPDTN